MKTLVKIKRTVELSAQICKSESGNSTGNRYYTGRGTEAMAAPMLALTEACSQKWGPSLRTGDLRMPPRHSLTPTPPPGQLATFIPGPLHSPLGTSFPEACKAERKREKD